MKKILERVSWVIATLIIILCLFNIHRVTADSANDLRMTKVGTQVDNENHTILVKYEIQNNSEDFINDLTFSSSLFKGNKINTNGSVLDGATFTLSASQKVSVIEPKSTVKQTLVIPIPTNIDNGNYIVYSNVQNEAGSIGLTWVSEETLSLSGTGGFISIPTPRVIYEGQQYTLLEGKEQKPGTSFVIDFNRGESIVFDRAVDEGQISIKYNISPLQASTLENEAMASGTVAIKKIKSGNTDVNRIVISPVANMPAGPYDVNLNIYNKGNQINIDPIIARWLVDGFVVRIGDILSGTNVVKNGPVDLIVDIHAKNGASKNGKFIAEFVDEEGVTVASFSHALDFGVEDVRVDFSDEKLALDKKTKVDHIKITVQDNEGNIFDVKNINVKSDRDYVKGSLAGLIWIYIAIALIIIFIIVLRLVRKTKTNIPLSVFLLACTLFTGIALSAQTAYGGRDTVPKPTITYLIVDKSVSAINGTNRLRDYFNGDTGNKGNCPQTVPVAFAAWHSCPHCANGITIKTSLIKNIFNSVSGSTYTTETFNAPNTGFPGGMGNNFGTSIFSQTLTLTNENPRIDYQVKAESVSSNHGFCLGSSKQSPVFSVSCTPYYAVSISLTGSGGGSCSSVSTLSWVKPAHGDAITGYKVFRSSTADSGFTQIGTVSQTQDSLTYEDNSAPPGTSYYKVQPIGLTEEVFSNTASISRPVDCNNDCTLTNTCGNPNGGGGNNNHNCSAGQSFCPTLDQCVSDISACPNACGEPLIASGGGVTPNTAGLCAPGYTPVFESIFARTSTNTWYWQCKSISDTSNDVSCSKRCPSGTFYAPDKGICTVDCPDWCPNIDGNQTSVAPFQRDDAGHCIAPDASIVYFRVRPDTAEVSCPGYWETQVGAGAHLSCKIGNENVPANLKDVTGAVGKLLDAGKVHTLACDVLLDDTDTYIKSISASARCFRPTDIIEQ